MKISKKNVNGCKYRKPHLFKLSCISMSVLSHTRYILLAFSMRLYIPNLGSECNRYYLNSLLWGLATTRKCNPNLIACAFN